MQFHPDYDKLGKVKDLMREIYPMENKIKELKKQIKNNDGIISSPAEYNFTPTTENYDRALASEQNRVEIQGRNKRKRRMKGFIIFSLILQIAMLAVVIVLLIPGFNALMLEPLAGSVILIAATHLAYQEAINQKRNRNIFKVATIGLGIILAIVYSVLLLVTLMPIPENPFFTDTLSKLTDLPASALLLAIAHALLAMILISMGEGICQNARVAMDESILSEAMAADAAENKRRQQQAKRQHEKNVASSREENGKLQAKINSLQATIAEKKKIIADIGVIAPDEYDKAGTYWNLIYRETMATGHQVDVSFARFKYMQDESERRQRQYQQALESSQRYNDTISEAFRREDERQAKQDFINAVNSASEAAKDLLRKWDS